MAEDNKYSFLHIKLNEHKPPEFKEKKGVEYVLFGNSSDYRNNYPQYLIDLYRGSSKHRALTDGKCDYINGRGWEIEAVEIDEKALLTVKQFIKEPNNFQPLKKLSKKCVFDSELFGGYYLEIIYSKRGKRKIVSVNHVPFQYIRTNKDKTKFYFTEDWSVKNKKPENNEDFTELKPYDPSNKDAKQLLAIDNSNSDGVYPLPPYLSANSYIESDIEVANFNLNNIKSGFSGGFMINFYNGDPSETQKADIEKQLINKHTGSTNAGRFILNFAESKDKGAEIIPITSNTLADQFKELNVQIRAEIFIAHKVINPALFGVAPEGGFGNNADELRTANDAFQNRYAQPRQEDLESVFNGILEINSLPPVLNIKPLEPIKKPIDNALMMSVMTKAEQREMLGLEVLEEEDNTLTLGESLSILNPLVAAKVLENLSAEEIRGMVGLSGAVVVAPTTEAQFKNQYELAHELENLTVRLENSGVDGSNFEILSSVDIDFDNDEDFNTFHNKTKLNFANIPNLSLDDVKVLSAIAQNPAASTAQLAQSTGLDVPTVAESIAHLNEVGALSEVPGDTGQVERNLTKDGEDSLPSEENRSIFVKYRYALRADVPPAKKSRDFCSRLMATPNKLYTKEEIDTGGNNIGSNGTSLSVWSHRGGYYNNPLTKRTSSRCRHIWQQVIVREKQN